MSTPADCPMIEGKRAFAIGPFSVGDLIALGSVVFMSGALWFRVASLEREDTRQEGEADRIVARIQALEQVIPSNYVRRDEYREDVREIKALLQTITVELKTKVDK
jgi:hypothetical protein